MRRALLPRVHSVRVQYLHLRARTALAAVEAGADRAALDVAERDARALSREPLRFARALGVVTSAAIATRRGRVDQALEGLRRAVASFEAIDMALYAASARRALGALVGGDEGAAAIAQADDAMRARGVRDPAAMARTLVPGVTSAR